MAMRSNGEHVVEIDTIVLNQINTSTTGNGNIRRTHLESVSADIEFVFLCLS